MKYIYCSYHSIVLQRKAPYVKQR